MILHLPLNTLPGHHRTGPLGRLARLGLLAIYGGSLYSIVDGQGSARFRNPHVLSEPSAWFLHIMMLIVFLVLVGTIASALTSARLVRRTQIAAAATLLASGVVAATVGQLSFGSLWGFPLADLVWWFDVAMLAVGVVSSALAIVLGTPGCEIGTVRDLVVCFRRTSPQSAGGPRCILGLHVLDEWERRRMDYGSARVASAPSRQA